MDFTAILHNASEAGIEDISNTSHDGRANWAYLSKKTVNPLKNYLMEYPPFKNFEGKVLARGRGAELVQAESTAQYLTDRAIRFGAERVSESFHRVLAMEVISFAQVFVVKNLSTELEFLCSDENISIEPIASLFPTPEREQAYELAQIYSGSRHEPTAVVSRIKSKPVFSDLYKMPDSPVQYPRIMHLNFPDIEPTLDAINIAVGADIITDASYCVVEECGWPTVANDALSHNKKIETVLCLNNQNSNKIPEITRLIKEHKQGEAIHHAMMKLRQAQSSQYSADCILNLGICLEILLMHGDTTGNSEIIHKLSVRAAWLFGDNSAEREEIYEIVRFAYSHRSQVAHKGFLKYPQNVQDEITFAEKIEKVRSLCVRLILHVMKNGWPNWRNITLQL